jgi:hypothetical protein
MGTKDIKSAKRATSVGNEEELLASAMDAGSREPSAPAAPPTEPPAFDAVERELRRGFAEALLQRPHVNTLVERLRRLWPSEELPGIGADDQTPKD